MFISKEQRPFLFKESTWHETLKLSLYAVFLFATPLILSHQLIVGVIVNAILIKAALNHKTKKVFILALIPSLGAIASGLIFGASTTQLVYLLPFIWVGNIILMHLMRKLFMEGTVRYFSTSIIAALAKTFFLFFSAMILFTFGLIPQSFLAAFSIVQLATALAGAAIVGFARVKKGAYKE
ncbi:MAG: hypothetical protein AABW59_01060 [archaeon]